MAPDRSVVLEQPLDGPPVAVVDIGSNSVRLVVYERLSRAPLPRFNEKALCRLGEGLDRTGAIAPAAFERVVDTIGRFAAIASAMDVASIDVLATEALRKASNGKALVDAITRASGFDVRILSGREEARYAALGVVAGFYRPAGMVGDMGGGSLELVEVADDLVSERFVSLPLGALPVQALLGEDAKAARERVDDLLRELVPPLLAIDASLFAVGGGWRTIARAHLRQAGVPVPVVHGYAVDGEEMRRFAKHLRGLEPDELAGMPGIAARRAPTTAAAALVLERVLKRLKPDRVVFSALGLREGWLYGRLRSEDRDLDPLVEGAMELGAMMARVPRFVPALVRWTDAFFADEPAAERRLRVAVCALTDIAWRDHPDVRAVEAFRRLLQFPFVGVDHPDRVFIAAAIHARYGGGGGDSVIADACALLAPSRRRRALVLGRLLLLGHRLSASVPELLDAARVEVESDRVRLVVTEAARIPDGEAVQQRLALLAKAIGLERTEVVGVEAPGRRDVKGGSRRRKPAST